MISNSVKNSTIKPP